MTEPTDRLLDQVVAAFDATPDPRLRQLVEAGVRHLHAFAREVGLRSDERAAGVRFLTAVGQACTETRQEMEMLSDVLGLSSVVETGNTPPGATRQTLTGPFYAAGSPPREFGGSMVERDDADPPAVLRGTVSNIEGKPLAGVTLDAWQGASNRRYAVQDRSQPKFNLRGKYTTGADGRYEIRTIRPFSYTIPDDGPVGDLLARTGRHPWRAAHLHLLVTKPGYVPLVTEVFDSVSDYLDTDAVFGVFPELVLDFHVDSEGVAAATFDIVLAEADQATEGA